MSAEKAKIHSTAEVADSAEIGEGTEIWNFVKIREGAKIGKNCLLHKGVFVDQDVTIGDKVKMQVDSSVFKGVKIGNGVFIGPHVCFTNDKHPRAVNGDLTLKSGADWTVSETIVEDGAAIGANATILPGIKIGKWAMIGAGSVVTKGVPDFGLVVGNPARLIGKVNKKGEKVND
ncbi:MAG: acyltransferase [bacterium]|nr:acyltransferase [bacterium]